MSYAASVFTVGDLILLRSFRHSDASLLSHGRPGRVIFDDDRGLMTWTGGGSLIMRMVAGDGTSPRTLADQRTARWRLEPDTWRPPGVLTLTPHAAAHSVTWFFDEDGGFDAWYVNLEEPQTRWASEGGPVAGGVDTRDNALDIVAYRAEGGNTWQWKDEDEFTERTGHPWYWDSAAARAIRAEGERVVAQIEAARFPFDGSFCDFRPDPAWPIHTDVTGYDRPHA